MPIEGGTGSPISCPGLAELPRAQGRGFPWDVETPRSEGPTGREEPPLVTIITPSLDQSRFLERTIRSVLLQGHPALEYMVLDGGSTDGSVELIRRYQPWISYWRSGPDGGQAASINEGLGRAKGDIVGWLNSDDAFLEGAIHAVARARAEDPDAVAYAGTGFNVDARGGQRHRVEPTGLTRDELASWGPNLIHQPACLVSADAFRRAGGVDEGMTCAFDFDLWLTLAALGRFRKVDAVLAEAVVHEDAKTVKWIDLSTAEHAVALMRRGYEAETIAWISRRMRPYVDIAARVRRMADNPLYRATLRPVLKLLGLVGKRQG